ncbi:hypothetical protein THASP1DRAFT_32292, partial [Thamnocephalis sphaerospora]
MGSGANTRFDLTGYETTITASNRADSYISANEYAVQPATDVPEEAKEQRACCFRTRRRMWIFALCMLLIIAVAIAIPVVIFVIAQASINSSNMFITSANLTAPQEDSFVMKMAGMVTDTGAFDAQLEFKDK